MYTPQFEGHTDVPAMLSPQPYRAFTAPQPENASWPNSPWSGKEEALSHELQNLMSGPKGAGQLSPDAMRTLESRPLSAVSTSAGPTPSPDEKSPDGYNFVTLPESKPPFQAAAMAMTTPAIGAPAPVGVANFKVVGFDSKSNGNKAALPSQVRKVFVGGVPQDLNQDNLYAIFSEFAKVKKAWLQRYRANGGNQSHSPPHNHRGFGFVIFHDTSAIELLLGGYNSRFLMLGDGRKLEVKRAVSSSDMRVTGEAPTLTVPSTTPAAGFFPGSNLQIEQARPPMAQPSPLPLQSLPQQAALNPWPMAQPQSTLLAVPWPGGGAMAPHALSQTLPQTVPQPRLQPQPCMSQPQPQPCMSQPQPQPCMSQVGTPIQGCMMLAPPNPPLSWGNLAGIQWYTPPHASPP